MMNQVKSLHATRTVNFHNSHDNFNSPCSLAWLARKSHILTVEFSECSSEFQPTYSGVEEEQPQESERRTGLQEGKQ